MRSASSNRGCRRVARLLEEAEHWRSTLPGRALAQAALANPPERFNRKIGRRTDVIGIFPDDAPVIRPVSMLAIEANDDWLVGRSYVSQGSMATLCETQTDTTLPSRSEEEVPELPRREHQRLHRRDEQRTPTPRHGIDS